MCDERPPMAAGARRIPNSRATADHDGSCTLPAFVFAEQLHAYPPQLGAPTSCQYGNASGCTAARLNTVRNSAAFFC